MRSSPMDPNCSAEEQVRRVAAADWFARMQRADCPAQDRNACRRWRDGDPANEAAYRQMERIFRQTGQLRADPDRQAFMQGVMARSARRGRRRRALRWTAGLCTVTAMLVAVGLGWRAWDPAQPERSYASAVGQQRTFTLEDGSRVMLDTDSAVRVRYSRKQRNLVLERGQAQFTVAKAVDRPFRVVAGDAAVRAVGTQFQVRRHPDDAVQVSLLEGVVEVSGSKPSDARPAPLVILSVGEQLNLTRGGHWVRQALDRQVVEGWTRGELVFRQAQLADLVAEMNRYTTTKMKIGDPGLDDIRLSGVFYGSDQDSLVAALEQLWHLRVERSSNEIVILRQ